MSAPSEPGEAAAAASEPAAAPADPVDLPTSDCSVCGHPQAAEIDAGLLSGTPIRTVASQYGVSRSSVGRHRLNHLSAAAITEPPAQQASGERTPLRIVDVHRELTDLADRLQHVVELATRMRKVPAATAAMRELRQVYEVIAKLQADPELKRAASAEAMRENIADGTGRFVADMIDFLAAKVTGRNFGEIRNQTDEWSRAIADLVFQVLTAAAEAGSTAAATQAMHTLPTPEIDRLRERDALDAVQRMEAEVQRRVEAELRRRKNQQRPALEVAPLPGAIEGQVPQWH